MKLHAIQNGNGDKNGELFGNELNSACKQQRYCKGTNFQISIWSKLKIKKQKTKKGTKIESGRIQTLEPAILTVLQTSSFHFGHIAHIVAAFTSLTSSVQLI